jgi:hypothetical protein
MLKSHNSLKKLEFHAGQALQALLAQVPPIEVERVETGQAALAGEPDIIAHVLVSGRPHVLICEVQTSGQPRHVRTDLLHLRDYLAHADGDATAILIAPYLSAEAQAMCREQGAGFLDLQGNAYLAFDGIFIDRLVAQKPAVARRELKSLFKPKSAQVLRVLLRDPRRAWRVTELADTAGVSLGHVSNVRVGLLDREWAKLSGDGMFLSDPDALLNAWRDAYEQSGQQRRFYTTLHGPALEQAAREILGVSSSNGRAAFASFSAAHWLSPFGRTGTQYFYADSAGLELIQKSLKLTSTSKGENVVVFLPKDEGVFLDAVEPAPGAICTSPVQTYLDLATAGERGREAADHLRREKLSWPK